MIAELVCQNSLDACNRLKSSIRTNRTARVCPSEWVSRPSRHGGEADRDVTHLRAEDRYRLAGPQAAEIAMLTKQANRRRQGGDAFVIAFFCLSS
jgi:hypothetical protein